MVAYVLLLLDLKFSVFGLLWLCVFLLECFWLEFGWWLRLVLLFVVYFVVGFCNGVCGFSFVIGVGLLGLVGGCFHVILFGLL